MTTNTIFRTDANAADLLKQSQENQPFALLPAGWYEATIVKAELVPFAKQGQYENDKALNVQLRILDGAPVGARRVFFLRVPMFHRFFPTQKNPQGAPATMFFDFFSAVGESADAMTGMTVKFDQGTLGGKRIGFRLVQREPDNFNPEKYNEVANVRPARALEGVAEPGQSAVGNAFAQPQQAAGQQSPWGGAPQQSAQPAQAGWNPGADSFAGAPAQSQGDSALQAAAEQKGLL